MRQLARLCVLMGLIGCGAADTEGTSRTPGVAGAGAAAAGGGAGVGGTMVTIPVGSTPIPCDIQQATTECRGCHGSTPIGGAPMALVTHEDFVRDHVVQFTEGMIGQTVKVYDLARMRLNDVAKPMPPSGEMAADHRATFDAWLAGGALAGGEADRNCVVEEPPPPVEPGGLVAEGDEVCYDLRVHAGGGEQDTTKYNVMTGEHYAEWTYNVPWKAGDVASRFGARFDNVQVLHHWLLYTDKSAAAAGTVRGSAGATPSEQLLAGWANGGENVAMPPDVGLELPPPGTKIMVQWHFYNSSGEPQPDGTVVQVCAVPAGSRPHTASMTWLGTEALAIGPGTGDFSGSCTNDSGADITVVVFWPHMHQLGRNMRSSINGIDVFNKPFQSNYQIVYNQDPPLVIKPGEMITSTCTFSNEAGGFVTFGPSSDQEMCYQFAFAYPAHALDNGATGLNGATNNCW